MAKMTFEENGEEVIIDADDIDEMAKKGIKKIKRTHNTNYRTKYSRSVRGKIVQATPLICTVVFLLLGFLADAWHPGWVVFIAIPIVPSLLYAFGENKKANILTILTIIITIAYVVVGTVWGIWHPTWIAFLLIPIASIFIGR
ncbi:MAG: hypothetical protein WCR33_02235 [Bacilli bacterium]